jgi:hypothetical protein
MMLEPQTVEKRPTTLYFLLAAGALAVIVGGAILLTRSGPSGEAPAPTLSEEQKAYLGEIEVSDAKMSAAENFLGHTVTYLDAVVANKGSRTVKRIEVQLEFYDTLYQVVLRDTAHPITARTPPLKPGEARSFQVSFEHMPMEWNQAPPRITPVTVEF